MKPVALTGGIASGKSAAARLFKNLGIDYVDADDVARDLLARGSGLLDRIAQQFGREALTPEGDYNRALVHPAVGTETRQRLAQLDQAYPLWVVPLLVETQQVEKADCVIVVDVPEAVQITRMMSRDGRSRQEAEQALAAQATRTDRLAIADFVIDNTASLDQLKEHVQQIHSDLLRRYDNPTG